ncbi:MAG: AAA family ATPase [Lentisphaerae bacterium]|nr:AAA family ATPase [Lentisphaerota bacterium]
MKLVFGARQTGKSVLLHRVLPPDASVIFNLLDSSLRRRFESEPAAFRREVEALDPKVTHVAVDEIQKVPALLEEVQYLFDRDAGRREFYLTGSSARKLWQHSANLLPGRCHLCHLYPVVRPEEIGFRGRLHDEHFGTSGAFPVRNLDSRLRLGSLPGVSAEGADTATATLEAYVENYLEEEVRREGLVRQLGPFSQFIRLAATESGRQTNVARLAQESGVPASTIRTYYQLLVDTFVGYWLLPYAHPGRKRLLTTPRFLFFDLGVRNVAAGMSLSAPLLPDTGGGLLEQWVGLELMHRAGYAGRTYGVSFWRTTSGAEVDFVWQAPNEEVPIEVKWTDNPRPADARHVETFLDLYAPRARRGFVVCRAPRAEQLTERTLAIPWQEL